LSIKKILEEETLKENYQFYFKGHHIYKTVVYFLAEVEGNLKLQAAEVWSAQWIKLSEAENLVTFPEAKQIIRRAVSLLT
jgi:hypothetical protein